MIQNKISHLLILGLIVGLVGCSDSNNNGSPKVDDCVGCAPPRTFSIDETKPEFVVDVFGRKMGTPDWGTIDDFLQAKKSSGDIDELTVLATGIEGGASYCVVVSDNTVRTEILDELQQISTDLEETAYSVESVDDCNE